jgi:hypothetical protein
MVTGTIRPIQSPGLPLPLLSVGTGKFTTVFPEVLPDISPPRRRLAWSTSTSATLPTSAS